MSVMSCTISVFLSARITESIRNCISLLELTVAMQDSLHHHQPLQPCSSLDVVLSPTQASTKHWKRCWNCKRLNREALQCDHRRCLNMDQAVLGIAAIHNLCFHKTVSKLESFQTPTSSWESCQLMFYALALHYDEAGRGNPCRSSRILVAKLTRPNVSSPA